MFRKELQASAPYQNVPPTYSNGAQERFSVRSNNTEEDEDTGVYTNQTFASVYGKYGGDSKGNGQGNNQQNDKAGGFYNINRAYQTEAIIEAPDEGDY